MEKETLTRLTSDSSQQRRMDFGRSRIPASELPGEDNDMHKDSFEKLGQHVSKGESLDLFESLAETNHPVDFQNEFGMTLLHLACKNAQQDSIRVLLQAGADPNKIDKLGRSPLHWVLDVECHCQFCSSKAYKCMDILLEYGANVNTLDNYDDSPLRYAAKSLLPKCALELVDQGAEIIFENTDNCIRYLLNDRMPEVLLRLMDKAIKFDEEDNSRLKLNFEWLYDRSGDGIKTTKTSSTNTDTKGSCRIRMDWRYSERSNTELKFLVGLANGDMNVRGRKEILTHPWVQAFLHLKWLAVRKWFWTVRLAYSAFVTFFTFFIFHIYIISCPYSKFYLTTSPNSKNFSSSNSSFSMNNTLIDPENRSNETCEQSTFNCVCGVVGASLIAILIKTEFFEFKTDIKAYVTNYLNIFWVFLIASLIVTVYPAFGVTPRPWHYPVASFGLFFVWALYLTYTSRVPVYGEYVEMLGTVLGSFFTFLMTFGALIVAFALGMCIMFPENEFFQSIPHGFVKSLILMIGEDDYEGLFKDNERIKDVEYAIPANLMYVGFLGTITIVMTNLLLGLAVSDIQELRKKSSYRRITRQIIQISFLESFINSSTLTGWLTSLIFSRTSVEQTIGRTCTISPLNVNDKLFPEDLKLKFIPYLTSSQCLIKHKRLKMKSILAPIRWKNLTRKTSSENKKPNSSTESVEIPSVSMDGDQIRVMFRSLSENLMDMKNQLEKLSLKIDRK